MEFSSLVISTSLLASSEVKFDKFQPSLTFALTSLAFGHFLTTFQYWHSPFLTFPLFHISSLSHFLSDILPLSHSPFLTFPLFHSFSTSLSFQLWLWSAFHKMFHKQFHIFTSSIVSGQCFTNSSTSSLKCFTNSLTSPHPASSWV